VEKGSVGKISGDAYNLLICERTILNVLSFMSGVATKVRNIVEKTKGKVKNCGNKKDYTIHR